MAIAAPEMPGELRVVLPTAGHCTPAPMVGPLASFRVTPWPILIGEQGLEMIQVLGCHMQVVWYPRFTHRATMLCGEDEGEGAPLEGFGVAMHVGARGPFLFIEQAATVRCMHETLKQVFFWHHPLEVVQLCHVAEAQDQCQGPWSLPPQTWGFHVWI